MINSNMFKHMLKLPSDPKKIEQVEHFVQDIATQYHIEQDKYPNILISLTEAVNNAIIHGNKRDRNKFVDIRIKKTALGLAFRVSDEGCGYDPDCIEDPTLPKNIERIGGRGVFLIQQLCDSVSFHDEGRTVEMHFDLK